MSFDTKKYPQEFYDLSTPEVDAGQATEDFKFPFGDEVDMSRGGKNNLIILLFNCK